jgi:transcriptional regulator with XRE-family HTH domain
MAERKRTLTDADKRAAAKVRSLWSEFQKKNPGMSQEDAAHRIGIGQSAFSQFLLGRVAIRLAPTLKFAQLFGVAPTEIRDDIPGLAAVPKNILEQPRATYESDTRTRRPRNDAEKLLVILQAWLETDADGREALYSAAQGITNADGRRTRNQDRRGAAKRR